MIKFKHTLFLLLVIATPVIIYLYFLPWKTTTIYGDDLYIFKNHSALNSFSEKISMPALFQKYRPLHGIIMHFLIEFFKKNINAYYCFNVVIQTINVFLFAAIANLFLKSPVLSLIVSFTVGLSRFSYFNITQMLNGGALEGLAISFFMLSLFYILRSVAIDADALKKYRDLLYAVLFANITMYTHERYIVLLPFIFLLVLIYPGVKIFTRKQKLILSLIAIASVSLNVFIKKEIYDMPFFVGTGGTKIEISTFTPFTYLWNGLLSILEVNLGPDYLVGIRFGQLTFFYKSLVVVLLFGFFITLFIYFRKFSKRDVLNQTEGPRNFWLLPFLGLLFILLLIPAVVTIRLEQRWLQASFIIFILCFVIAFTNLPFRNEYSRASMFLLFPIVLFCCDFTYLHKGAENIYMTSTEKLANRFETAIDKKIILPETQNLYLWEKQKDTNTENGIKWLLAEGYFFNFYQQHEKNIYFLDSFYQKDPPDSNSFINFNKNNDQLIYIDNNIIDITKDFLHDSLKVFNNTKSHLPN